MEKWSEWAIREDLQLSYMEEKGVRDNLITTFKFSNQTDKVDSE